MTDKISLVVDVKLRRPGCVIIQACYGCGDERQLVSQLFDPHTWLTAPTDDMYLISGTRDQWEAFARECNERTHGS